jgi:hypothetical protein
METHDNKFYYEPVPDERTHENAMEKASFLTDNGYINLTSGFTFETLVEQLIEQELNKPKE